MACVGAPGVGRADVDPLSGVDFVRVGAVGNAPWMGNGTSGDIAIGRGSVGYEYSIGRFEITTAQWAEFMNAAFDRPASEWTPHVSPPSRWGGVAATPTAPGGLRWTVPAGNEMLPVGGISWRTAAIYCNWLSNGKSTDVSAFRSGAYDVATFLDNGNGFSDQVTHSANAQYWIPTWDEWIKAAHYDPNRFGPGQPGYWIASNTLGHLASAGPPGVGEANYGFVSPNPSLIPLGAYPGVTSAWGLLDTAGGTSEWTEQVFFSLGQPAERGYEGSYFGSLGNAAIGDSIYTPLGSSMPGSVASNFGFRLASSVPAPATCLIVGGLFGHAGTRDRRRGRRIGAFTRPGVWIALPAGTGESVRGSREPRPSWPTATAPQPPRP